MNTPDLLHVMEHLSKFYSFDEAWEWINAEHELLNGKRAIDLIDNGRTAEVLAVIARLDAEVYI